MYTNIHTITTSNPCTCRWGYGMKEGVLLFPHMERHGPYKHYRTTACMPRKAANTTLAALTHPILPIRPTDLVLDELHALLRISDVLLRNLIFLVDTMEHRARLRTGTADITMQHLEDRIKSCGVSFTIRQVKSHLSIIQF